MSMKSPFSTVGELGILVDSTSVEKLLLKSDSYAHRFVSYHDSSRLFRFVRSSFHTSQPVLKRIPEIAKENGDKQVPQLVISGEDNQRRIWFSYRMKDVEMVGKTVYEKDSLTEPELNSILLVFFQRILNEPNGYGLLATENTVLLRHSSWFESHAPGGVLNIVDVQEAMTTMDLFAKLRDTYCVSAHSPTVNKGYWYLLSFRSKIRHYTSATKNLEGFASRFKFLLMSLDEIGSQFYLGANNDTMDNSLYHFNYFVSLASGIFDSLAIETRHRLGLQFKGENIPARTSLYRKAGKDFRRAVATTKPELWNDIKGHIRAYDDFLEVIRELREVVLHREGLPNTAVAYRGEDARWQGNFIQPKNDVAGLIEKYENGDPKKSRLFRWGPYISPYHFATALAQTLVEFSDEYLRLLGFQDSIGGLSPDDEFRKLIKRFETGRLGF